MSIDEFINRLRVIHSLGDDSAQFIKIRIADDILYYETDSGKVKSIDLRILFHFVTSEPKLTYSVIERYFTRSSISFISLLLVESGFYLRNDERMVRVAGFERNDEKPGNQQSWKYKISILHFFPVAFIILTIVGILPEGLKDRANWVIAGLLVLVNVSFFYYTTIIKHDQIKEETYTAYFTLLIFNIGIFPLLNFVRDYQEKNRIPMEYTVGLRAWGSEVEFYDIKVTYFDTHGNLWSISDSIINNSYYWTGKQWVDDNKSFDFRSDSIWFNVDNQDKLHLILRNCGAIIDPVKLKSDFKELLKAKNFYVEAKFRLNAVDPFYLNEQYPEKYQSAQLCLKVPVSKNDNQVSSNYYAYEFPFVNFEWSKLRIPGLNFDYDQAQLFYRAQSMPADQNARKIIAGIDSTMFNNLYRKMGPKMIETAIIGDTIRLSALLLDNNASFNIFNIRNSHSLPLFNFNIAKYGSFILKEEK